jgi:hypothetical protein
MNRNDHNPDVREDIALESSIGLLELCSVARGVEVADAVLKEASVEMLFATPGAPGQVRDALHRLGAGRALERAPRRRARRAPIWSISS